MNNNVFRIGIIGCGRIASRHADACVRSPGIELAALVDPVVDRANELAEKVGVTAKVTDTVKEMLSVVDGVVIATPNHLHRDLAVECLQAGVPVLIEKPLAVSVAECEDVCRVSEEQGVVSAVGYVTRFQDNVQLMHSLLETGYFGKIRRFVYQFGGLGGWSPYSAYNLDRRAMGGGVLVGTGSHFLDRMIYWFGYPDEASLQDDSLGGPEANAHAYFRYHCPEGDIEGLALFSRTVTLPPTFIMETDSGIVFLDDRADSQIRFQPNSQPGIELTIGRQRKHPPCNAVESIFQLQLEDFVDACRSRRTPTISARVGLESVRLIEHLYSNHTPMRSGWYHSLSNKEAV